MRFFSILALCGIAAWPGPSSPPAGASGTGSGFEPIVRPVYVTVTDGQGSSVPDLNAIVAGINGLLHNPSPNSNLTEARPNYTSIDK